jgi:hypothetical protein
MKRVPQALEDTETPVIFLAMFWGGGGPYTIAEIIYVYDWINRAIPTRDEMESALNMLLAMGQIEKQHAEFQVSRTAGRAFDAFRKRRRKNKFAVVKLYFKQVPRPASVPGAVRLTEAQYKAHIQAYHQAFAEGS